MKVIKLKERWTQYRTIKSPASVLKEDIKPPVRKLMLGPSVNPSWSWRLWRHKFAGQGFDEEEWEEKKIENRK